MFDSIHISYFRGIRLANINQLKRVNLFFGRNNSGKSSVLEAILLLCGPSNPLLPLQINKLRGYFGVSEKDLSLDFYHMDSKDIFISCQATSNASRSLRIYRTRLEAADISIDDLKNDGSQVLPSFHGIGIEFSRGDSQEVYTSNLIVHPDLAKMQIKSDERYKEEFYAEYIPSNYMQITMQDKYAQIVKQKGSQAIVDVLNCIEPRIHSIQLVGNDVMVDVGLSQLLPINLLGDGIRKIFSILVTVAYCKNGILLIDEVDNGFHYTAMKVLWEAILQMAHENNVQLFITSHNIDSVKGLLQACENSKEKQEELSVYKLIKKDNDEILSLQYDYHKLQYMINQEMEIR